MQPQFVGDDCESTSVHTGDFQDAEDLSAFRMITRRNGDQGYLFVNNYQRGYEMAEHKDVMLRVQTADGEIRFPKQDIKNGAYFFYPFNCLLPTVHGSARKLWMHHLPHVRNPE